MLLMSMNLSLLQNLSCLATVNMTVKTTWHVCKWFGWKGHPTDGDGIVFWKSNFWKIANAQDDPPPPRWPQHAIAASKVEHKYSHVKLSLDHVELSRQYVTVITCAREVITEKFKKQNKSINKKTQHYHVPLGSPQSWMLNYKMKKNHRNNTMVH